MDCSCSEEGCGCGSHEGRGSDECCGSGEGRARRFLTKEEKIAMLKEYKEYLDNESKGVAERIKELQKK